MTQRFHLAVGSVCMLAVLISAVPTPERIVSLLVLISAIFSTKHDKLFRKRQLTHTETNVRNVKWMEHCRIYAQCARLFLLSFPPKKRRIFVSGVRPKITLLSKVI